MAYDEGLAERIRSALEDERNVTEKKMFGGIAFLLGEHMFVGIVKDDLMVRVGPERHEEAVSRPHARPMDFTGKPMNGYVFVSPAGAEEDSELRHWIQWAKEFVSALPPKKKRPAQKSKSTRATK